MAVLVSVDCDNAAGWLLCQAELPGVAADGAGKDVSLLGTMEPALLCPYLG